MRNLAKACATTLALLAPLVLVPTVSVGTATAVEPPAVADDFARPDSKDLGTATSGQRWTQHAGSFSVSGGTALGSGGFGLASIDSARNDAAVSLTVTAPGSEHWLVIRLQDQDDYWRFGRSGSGAYRLQLLRAGAVSSPGVSLVATVGAAVGDRLECRTAGTLACFVNGKPVARTPDPSLATMTRHGFSTWQGSGVRFDDFAAGPVPPAPDVTVSVQAPSQVPAGGTLNATAVVANTGQGTATSAALVWAVPSDLTSVSGATSAGSCTPASGALRCPVGDLPPGSEVTATMSATTPVRSGSVQLSASVTQTSVDGAPLDDEASATVLLRSDLAPGTVVADGFARPDDPNGLGTSETGHLWTTLGGSPAVLGEAASLGGGYGLATIDSGLSTGTVSVTVPTLGTEYWLVTRLAGPGDYWRFGRSGSGSYELQLIQSGALASPTLDVRATVVPRAGDRLSCRLTDAAMTCSVGGVDVVRTTDAAGRVATRHGLAAYASPETRFDSFDVVALSPRPDLRTSLSVPRLLPTGGDTTASVTVLNGGTAPAPAATVTVAVPAGATASNGQPNTCTVAGNLVTCRLGDLLAGASAGVSVRLRAPTTPGPITTTATARSSTVDDDTANDTASAGSLVYDATQPPPLAFDSFSRPDLASPGSTETGQAWRLHSGTLAVAGSAAAPGPGYVLASVDVMAQNGVVATRVAQPGPEFWSVIRLQDSANFWRFGRSGGGSYQLQLIRSNALASPAVETVTTLTPAAGDRLECRAGSGLTCSVNGVAVARTLDASLTAATAYGLSTWYSPETRLDDFSVTELPRVPDLAATLTGTRSVVVSGGLAYTATVANVGTAKAESTVLSGSLPVGATGITVTPSAGSCKRSGTSFTCSFGQLLPAASRTVQLTATAPSTAGATTAYVNARTASADGEASNDTASITTTVRLATPPGTVVRDDFERADAAQLGNATTGQPWAVVTGGFGVVSGRAAPARSATNQAMIDPGFSFGTIEVAVPAGATAHWWLAVRAQDGANQYRIGPDPTTGEYRLTKVLNGVPRTIFAYNARHRVLAADGDVLRVVVRPDDGIYVWVNGQQVLDAGDQDLLDATGVGLGATGDLPRFDDLVISSVVEAYPVTDTFTRSDSTTGLGTPETGTSYPWTSYLGDVWGVRSGRAAPLTTTGGVVGIDASTEAAGVRARFSTIGAEQWLVFRYAEDGSYYRFGAASGGRYQLQFVRGYAVQPLPVPLQTLSPPLVAADQLVAVVQRLDGSVELSVNGTVTHRFTDTATNRRATIYGLATEGGVPRFDDVVISPAPRS